MASVQRMKDKAGKFRYRVQFYDARNGRHSVSLGRTNRANACLVADHIQELVDATKARVSPSPSTKSWLETKSSEKIRSKLSSLELCTPKPETEIEEFLTGYISSRRDASKNTIRNLNNSAKKLIDFFGCSTSIHGITQGDADDWRQFLVDKKYAKATISKAVKHAKQFFSVALRKDLLSSNPFQHLKAGGEENELRKRFIDRETIEAIIEAAPNTQWKLIIALARYGGLRCPSEILALRWEDINWSAWRIKVASPKTRQHGKSFREVPLFPELADILLADHQSDENRSGYVISTYRLSNANLRTQFERIIKRAGFQPWEKLFQNLRASRETELANQFPLHVVTSWLGNTERVASKHYLQVTDDHFSAAVLGQVQPRNEPISQHQIHASKCAKNGAVGAENVPNLAPQAQATIRTESQETKTPSGLTTQVPYFRTVTVSALAPPRGVEPLSSD